MQAFIGRQEGSVNEWMQLTSKSSERRWKNKYCVLPVFPQSITLSMQEDAMSSYNSNIQSRGRFKAKSRGVVEEILLGPVPFHRMPICAGEWVYGPFFLIQKDIPNFNLAEKEAFLHLLLRTARIQDKAGIKLFSKHMLAIPVWNLPNCKIKGIRSWRWSCCSSRCGNNLTKRGIRHSLNSVWRTSFSG